MHLCLSAYRSVHLWKWGCDSSCVYVTLTHVYIVHVYFKIIHKKTKPNLRRWGGGGGRRTTKIPFQLKKKNEDIHSDFALSYLYDLSGITKFGNVIRVSSVL